MDAARWRRIEALCLDALDQAPETRDAWLADACGGDTALHDEVATLLDHLNRDPGFLERPLVDPNALDAEPGAGPPVPEFIGPYQVEGRLGIGGMGEVFRATKETDGVRQIVAIKVVRPGMGSAEILQRFRLERRILAGLDHPKIARLLDAGALPDGRPYFVMEAVEGTPITTHCDSARLTLRERVRLFQGVCEAVQHAHQRLVLHRDLKPANILVTPDGVIKLLDFGIGKVLGSTDGDTPRTRQQARLMTPEYASPEQLDGAEVTTATDVYALGVLLYELLCGRHPSHRPGQTRTETERRIRAGAPSRPSVASTRETDPPDDTAARRGTTAAQLRRALAGDLDTIVLMALRNEPARRYPSATALAEDLQRWLDGRPVRARPDTIGYRTRKFLRRNAAWSVAAAVGVLGLAATTSVAVVQAGRVRREAARVAAERDKALEVRGFLMEMFGASGAGQQVGDTVTVRGLLDRQVAALEATYAGQPQLRAEMLGVLADGYDRLGLLPRADSLARAALDLRRSLPAADRTDLAGAINLAGWIAHQRGRRAEAESLLVEAIAIRRAAGPPAREDLARSLNDLGVVLNAERRYPEAEAVLREALDIRLEELGPLHRAVGITGNNLAAAYYFQRRFQEAVAAQEVAVDAIRAALGTDHQRTVVALGNLAAMRRAAGDLAGTVQDLRDLVAIQIRLQGEGHPVTARTRIQLATALGEQGLAGDSTALGESRREYERARANLESALGPDHPDVGTTLSALSRVRMEQGELEGALADTRRATAILRGQAGGPHPGAVPAHGRAAVIEWRMGHRDAAIATQRELVGWLAPLGAPRGADLARARLALCEFLLGRDGPRDAAEAGTQCALARAAFGADSGLATPALQSTLRLVQAHRRLGRWAEADSALAEARQRFGDSVPSAALRLLLDSLGTRPGG